MIKHIFQVSDQFPHCFVSTTNANVELCPQGVERLGFPTAIGTRLEISATKRNPKKKGFKKATMLRPFLTFGGRREMLKDAVRQELLDKGLVTAQSLEWDQPASAAATFYVRIVQLPNV